MIIKIHKNKVIIKKANIIFVLIDYGTLDDLQDWVSAWIEAEMRLKGDKKKILLKM
jgi:hypothetical protein